MRPPREQWHILASAVVIQSSYGTSGGFYGGCKRHNVDLDVKCMRSSVKRESANFQDRFMIVTPPLLINPFVWILLSYMNGTHIRRFHCTCISAVRESSKSTPIDAHIL